MVRAKAVLLSLVVAIVLAGVSGNTLEGAPNPPPLAPHLLVWADDCQVALGSWAKVDGLEVTWDVVEYRAGENANHRWLKPGTTKFTTIKLTRVASAESQVVKQWIDDLAATSRSSNLVIELVDEAGEAPIAWRVDQVVPTKWSINGFDAGNSKLPTETLEIAHSGFLERGACPVR